VRNISFMLTWPQALAQLKTVTRRVGWEFLRPGDLLQQVEKGMGLKKGDKITRGHVISTLEVSREQLSVLIDEPAYGRAEVDREGFPHFSPEQFVEMFCRTHNCKPEKTITRIWFAYDRPGNAPACLSCLKSSWTYNALGQVACSHCSRVFPGAPSFNEEVNTLFTRLAENHQKLQRALK